MSRSNVLRFPTDPAGGKGLKAFAILMYLSLAYSVINPAPLLSMLGIVSGPVKASLPDQGCIGLLLMLGALYGIVVRKWYQNNPMLTSKPWLGIVVGFFLAFSLWQQPQLIPVLIVLSVAYWLLVSRTGKEAPYFLRFHLLTAMISTGLLLLPVLLFQAILHWFESVFKLSGLGLFVSIDYWFQLIWPFVTGLLFWGTAFWLSFNALMGRTPYLPIVTDNVRQLA
jgi:hypothetical protein